MKEIFHSGERQIQNKVGEEFIANSNARIINGTIITGAIKFIENQPMAIVSSMDNEGQVWTSILIGELGFAKVGDGFSA